MEPLWGFRDPSKSFGVLTFSMSKGVSQAKMARLVSQEIARAFNRHDIADATKLCYERPPEFINEYLEDNFNLAPPQEKDYLNDPANSEKDPDTDEADVLDEQAPDDRDTNNDRVEVDSPTADEEDNEDDPPAPRPTRAPRPTIIDRFARDQGFFMNGSGKFYHADGSSLEKNPWKRVPLGAQICDEEDRAILLAKRTLHPEGTVTTRGGNMGTLPKVPRLVLPDFDHR